MTTSKHKPQRNTPERKLLMEMRRSEQLTRTGGNSFTPIFREKIATKLTLLEPDKGPYPIGTLKVNSRQHYKTTLRAQRGDQT